jgi:hypothetical protein
MILTCCLYLFVKQYIGILILLKFKLWFVIFIFSSETFLLYLFSTYLIYKLIIKAIPFIVGLNKWIIMATLRGSRVNHSASQDIWEVWLWLWTISCQVVGSIFLHVKNLWKFKITIYFYLSHLVKIELKPF